jgi:hypothetical protein
MGRTGMGTFEIRRPVHPTHRACATRESLVAWSLAQPQTARPAALEHAIGAWRRVHTFVIQATLLAHGRT